MSTDQKGSAAPGRPGVILTGATGYVGKHLLHALLQAGYQVAVLTRNGQYGVSARIAQALAPLGPSALEHLHCIAADLSVPGCGLGQAALQQLEGAGYRAFIHCAGMTRFDDHMADALQRTNYLGTTHAFALCKCLGIADFMHVSTAFVAGRTATPFSQHDLDRGQQFNNPYEQSKLAAEQFLHQASELPAAPNIRIYRPSIVVGGHPVGESSHVSTLYTFIKALRFLKACCRRDLRRGKGRFAVAGICEAQGRMTLPLRIAANPQTRINLVAIEQIVAQLLADLGRELPRLSTQALLGQDMSLLELQQGICAELEVDGLCFVQAAAFEHRPKTTVEAFFHRATSEYQPYLLSGVQFADEEKDSRYSIDITQLTREFCQRLSTAGRAGDQSGEQSLNQMVLNTLAVHGAEDYFARMVSGQMGSSLLRRIAYVSANVRFMIQGAPAYDRVIRIDHGKVTFTAQGCEDFSYEMSAPLFNDIIHGQADLRKSFFLGKVKIRGDLESALKFGFLLGDYLNHVDDHVMDEVIGL